MSLVQIRYQNNKIITFGTGVMVGIQKRLDDQNIQKYFIYVCNTKSFNINKYVSIYKN